MTASKEYRKRGAAKAFVLMIFLVAVFWLVRFTPVREYLAVEKMAQILAIAGLWAPIAYILLYAAGVCIFLPGTLLAAVGAAIFGPYYGFVFVWIGAMIGASLAFFIGRYLGRDFAASLIGSKMKKYDDTIARNGFATVLYLRLIYFPFTPMNFAMGLTNVRFRDYFFGTAVGILAGTFYFYFFYRHDQGNLGERRLERSSFMECMSGSWAFHFFLFSSHHYRQSANRKAYG